MHKRIAVSPFQCKRERSNCFAPEKEFSPPSRWLLSDYFSDRDICIHGAGLPADPSTSVSSAVFLASVVPGARTLI